VSVALKKREEKGKKSGKGATDRSTEHEVLVVHVRGATEQKMGLRIQKAYAKEPDGRAKKQARTKNDQSVKKKKQKL